MPRCSRSELRGSGSTSGPPTGTCTPTTGATDSGGAQAGFHGNCLATRHGRCSSGRLSPREPVTPCSACLRRQIRTRGGADGGAAQDGLAPVEDGRLAPGYAARRVVQADPQGAAIDPGRAGVDLAVSAQLDEAVECFNRRGAAGPDRTDRGDLADVKALGGTHGDGSGHRLDVQHVTGPPVLGWPADAQPAALADGVGVRAVVLAKDGARGVDDL